MRGSQGRGAHCLNLKAKLVTPGPGTRYMVLCRTVATPNDCATNLVAQRTSLGVVRRISDPHKGTNEGYALWTNDEWGWC